MGRRRFQWTPTRDARTLEAARGAVWDLLVESGLAAAHLPAFLDSALRRAGWVRVTSSRAVAARAPAPDRTWAEIRDLVKGAAVMVNMDLPRLDGPLSRGSSPVERYRVDRRDDDREWAFKEAVREALGLERVQP